MKLESHDLRHCINRLPRKLRSVMEKPEWRGRVFVGGGFLRAVVAGEPLNDIDLFVPSVEVADRLALQLCSDTADHHRSQNAITFRIGRDCVQIIHRWVFNQPEDVANSFDFTVCCAVLFTCLPVDPALPIAWDSFADDRFYVDLAAKRLFYRNPVRDEEAGGSMLRVLKYYQRGYRIPLECLADVMARVFLGVREEANGLPVNQIILGLLREVDPLTDPNHEAH